MKPCRLCGFEHIGNCDMRKVQGMSNFGTARVCDPIEETKQFVEKVEKLRGRPKEVKHEQR